MTFFKTYVWQLQSAARTSYIHLRQISLSTVSPWEMLALSYTHKFHTYSASHNFATATEDVIVSNSLHILALEVNKFNSIAPFALLSVWKEVVVKFRFARVKLPSWQAAVTAIANQFLMSLAKVASNVWPLCNSGYFWPILTLDLPSVTSHDRLSLIKSAFSSNINIGLQLQIPSSS